MCGLCRRKHREYTQVKRIHRRETGLCGHCGRVPESDDADAYCDACKKYFRNYLAKPENKAKNRAAQAKVRAVRIEEGFCHRCLARQPMKGKSLCEECREYGREYQRSRKNKEAA